MAKTKYQESAMAYAKNYLERLLDMEDMLGHNVNERIDRMVEQKVQAYLKTKREPDGDDETKKP